jgi:hypothetical protein
MTVQIVEVDGLAFSWAGQTPLHLGDVVRVPLGPRTTEGQVTSLGSKYDGPMLPVLARRVSFWEES